VFAPTLAIIVVIGIKIKKAGILINPILNGRFVSKYDPEIKNPIAPKRAIINPIAAALPIAFLIGYPKYFKTGTFMTAPPIPIGADTNPDIKPKTILGTMLNFFLVLIFESVFNNKYVPRK
tara:strand:+ start:405 stop:767 length:363 start_codon:yes stop_codon:yes gene_type:complete